MTDLFSYPAGSIVNNTALSVRTAMPPCLAVVNGITHGPEICALWPDEDLADKGIKRVVADDIPTDANGWPYLPGDPVDLEGEVLVHRTFPAAMPDAEGWSAHLLALGTEARAKRDALLAECDWTQLADAPISDALKASWKTYRQALRDVPEQPAFPLTISWPTQPSE